MQGRIFQKRINHLVFVFFVPMFTFFKKMYSKGDETDVLEVQEIKFSCPTMIGKPVATEFCKYVFSAFYNLVVISQ